MPSQRQVKVPLRFNNYVVKNLSQKHVDDGSDGFVEKSMVGIGIVPEEIREKDAEIVKGVFGNPDNNIDESANPNVGDVQSSNNIDEDVFVNNTDNMIETPKMNTALHNSEAELNKTSYAKIVNNQNNKDDNKVKLKPIVISDEGNEFVVFDEELVQKGSARWKLTLCGYFVGCKMSEYELNYNLRKMWSKYELVDVKSHLNGNCFLKFRNEIGMTEVLNHGPWIVNHRPLFVKKWDPTIGMEKKEMSTITMWERVTNVPLEA
ncbi:RNA-directed DNA polymerase, eukaryota, reverse transcriptase zinc-binding domain protein [Tanacetum coccineum]